MGMSKIKELLQILIIIAIGVLYLVALRLL